MPFLNNPAFRICGEKEFILLEPLRHSSGRVIPEGFITDFASIPQAAQWLIPVNDLHRLPAVGHDERYVRQDIPRSEADAEFLQDMKDAGVSWWKRNAMYLAVRAGGWAPWNSNAERLKTDRASFLAENGLK